MAAPNDAQSSNTERDLPPALTTVAYDPVLPLVRVPVLAGPSDNPDVGSHLLAFRDENGWRKAWGLCEEQIVNQCEVGVRMGCSISASQKCQQPWWRKILFLGVKQEMGEREACEDREMAACISSSRESCCQLAQNTCEPIFSDQQIVSRMEAVPLKFLDRKSRQKVKALDRIKSQSQSQSQSRTSSIHEGEKSPSARLAEQAMEKCRAQTSSCTEPDDEVRYSNVRKTKNLHRGKMAASFDMLEVKRGKVVKRLDEEAGWEGGLIKPKIVVKKN